MPSADEEDVMAVLNGDVERFEGIVQRWQRPLVNLAYRFVRDEGRAEERGIYGQASAKEVRELVEGFPDQFDLPYVTVAYRAGAVG